MAATIVMTGSAFPDAELERQLIERTGVELVDASASTPEELLEVDRDVVGIVTADVPVRATVFGEFDNLEVVVAWDIVDAIDVDAATTHGVPVVNVPTRSAEEVSTHTFGLVLVCERHIAQYDEQVRSGGWNWQEHAPIHRLSRKTLGVVGYGASGRRIAEKASGLGVNVISFDPDVPFREMEVHNVEKVDFEELCKRSDIITVHAPLTDEPQSMFDDDAFEWMSDSATFVNVARGEIVDEDALYRALTTEQIAAAGLDLSTGDSTRRERLVALDNVVITPCVGWYSEEALITRRQSTVDNVVCALDGTPRNLLNPEVFN